MEKFISTVEKIIHKMLKTRPLQRDMKAHWGQQTTKREGVTPKPVKAIRATAFYHCGKPGHFQKMFRVRKMKIIHLLIFDEDWGGGGQ